MLFTQENSQLQCQVFLKQQKQERNLFAKKKHRNIKIRQIKFIPQTKSECDYFIRCQQQQFSIMNDSFVIDKLALCQLSSLRWFQDAIIAIESVWQNLAGQILFKSFGTGVLIRPQIILTTAHNLFSEKSRSLSKRIYLSISNLDKQQIITDEINPQLDILQPNEYYSSSVLEKDLALIRLNLPVSLKQYMKIDENIRIDETVEIVGFPYFNNQTNRSREDLKGKVKYIDNHTIIHNLPTKNGHSGSPIIYYFNYQGNIIPRICGLHTHKSLQFYRGLLITEKLKEKIYKFIRNLIQ